MYPFVACLIIPAEDNEILVGCSWVMRDCKEIGVMHIINARDIGLEFITMFEAR